MTKKLLPIILLLSFVTPSHGDYFDGFKCNQDFPKSKEMELEYVEGISFELKWYKINRAKAKFGDIESDIVNYLFWNDKFFGKVCGIIGKDNINGILRFFKREVESIYVDKHEDAIFKEPVIRKDNSTVFIEPDKIIVVERFSLHLSQVGIFCRELYLKRYDIIEEEGEK